MEPMRRSSGTLSSGRARHAGECAVSRRRSTSGHASAAAATAHTAREESEPSPHRLADVPLHRQNELANAPSLAARRHSKERDSACEAGSAEHAESSTEADGALFVTPTRVVKTPPTKVRQRLARASTTGSTSVSPMVSPQSIRAPVEKSQPGQHISDSGAGQRVHDRRDEGEDIVVSPSAGTAARTASPSLPATAAAIVAATPSKGFLSATFDTAILIPPASVSRSLSEASSSTGPAGRRSGSPAAAAMVGVPASRLSSATASRRASDDVGEVEGRRIRALAKAHERHRTWTQLELAERLRQLEATRERVEQESSQLQSVKAEKRKFEDKMRVVEELHVLTDMLTEKHIRTEARTVKRDTLNNIWQQLQLLCSGVATEGEEEAEAEGSRCEPDADDGEAEADMNNDVSELGSDVLEDDRDARKHGARPVHTSHVHEYEREDVEEEEEEEEDDEVPEEPDVTHELRTQNGGRAESPEVFAFPCNRHSISIVKTRRQTHRAGSNLLQSGVEVSDEETPEMEPLALFSPDDEPLESVLPRLSGNANDEDEDVSASRSPSGHHHRRHDSSTSAEVAGEDDEAGALMVEPSATHRCQQEHLRLGRDPSASRARSISMAAASVAPADPREVLTNFLAELLFEIEELAQVCIQAPAPCAQTCLTAALRRRAKHRHRDDHALLKRGFFSFFGGATESHLSAKPLSTFLTCARRLESAGWLMEAKLQLLVRELSTEEEEEALRQRCVDMLTRKHAAAPEPVEVERGVPMAQPVVLGEEDISKSLFSSSPSTSSASSQEEWCEEEDETTPEQAGGQLAGPPLLPRPPLPSASNAAGGDAAGSVAIGHGVRKASDSGVIPVGLEAMLPSLTYAMPLLSTVTRTLDAAQNKMQAEYKSCVEAEKQRRRLFIARLKEAYRTVEAPALQRELRRLRWAQQQLTEELIELGITDLVLEWNVPRPLRYLPIVGTESSAPAAAAATPLPRATALLVESASDVHLYGTSSPYSAAIAAKQITTHGLPSSSSAMSMEAALCRRCVTVRIPVSTVIRASLERHQQQRRHKSSQPSQHDLVSAAGDLVMMESAVSRASCHLSSSAPRTGVAEEDAQNVCVGVKDTTEATRTASATAAGLQTISPKHVTTMGVRPSLGTMARLASPRLSSATSRLSGASSGVGHSVLLRVSSARTSTDAADVDDEANPDAIHTVSGEAAGSRTTTPRRCRSASRSCYFRKEVIERHVRSTAHDASPASGAPPNSGVSTTPLQVVRMTYKSTRGGEHQEEHEGEASAAAVGPVRECVVVVEEQETELAAPLVMAVASRRHNAAATTAHPTASSSSSALQRALQEDEEAVVSAGGSGELLRLTQATTAVVASPELMAQESALARGAVRATIRFCGEEAVRRREAAEATEQHVKHVWQLREELARLEEANYIAERDVDELTAELDRVAAEREAKLYEARTKLNATKSFFGVLKKEHDEWADILSDLKRMIEPEADVGVPVSSSSVSAPPSLVRRDRRRFS